MYYISYNIIFSYLFKKIEKNQRRIRREDTYLILFIIMDKTTNYNVQYFHIYKRNSKNIFFSSEGQLGNILFSLLLEIGRSNSNTKISIYIKDMQNKIFLPGASFGEVIRVEIGLLRRQQLLN